uniref:Uncharacterized protein n=1 Tax=Picea sitchensis TaxID=3332 RepID=A9NL06_PICSI|nr:unknown [Picea sitchensis]
MGMKVPILQMTILAFMAMDTMSLYIDNLWLSSGTVFRHTILCKFLIAVSPIPDVKSHCVNSIREM